MGRRKVSREQLRYGPMLRASPAPGLSGRWSSAEFASTPAWLGVHSRSARMMTRYHLIKREKSYVKEICGPQEGVQLRHTSTGQRVVLQ